MIEAQTVVRPLTRQPKVSPIDLLYGKVTKVVSFSKWKKSSFIDVRLTVAVVKRLKAKVIVAVVITTRWSSRNVFSQ